MVKSLEQLRAERDALLRKARGKKSLEQLAARRRAEERKLKAEIRALKNPGSEVAKKQLKSAAKGFGQFLKRVATNINAAIEEEERKEKARRKRTVKKRKKR